MFAQTISFSYIFVRVVIEMYRKHLTLFIVLHLMKVKGKRILDLRKIWLETCFLYLPYLTRCISVRSLCKLVKVLSKYYTYYKRSYITFIVTFMLPLVKSKEFKKIKTTFMSRKNVNHLLSDHKTFFV